MYFFTCRPSFFKKPYSKFLIYLTPTTCLPAGLPIKDKGNEIISTTAIFLALPAEAE